MLASAGLRTSIGSRRMSVFWSEMDVADLAHSLATGQSVSEVARFLCRDEPEVRDKMKELGLVERPS
jgi:hypothetical protein